MVCIIIDIISMVYTQSDNLQELLNKHSSTTITTYGIQKLNSYIHAIPKMAKMRHTHDHR